MAELHQLTALHQRDLLARGELSPVDLVRHYLDRISSLDPALGAFVELTADAAVARAAELASRGPDGGLLWGLPFADKDLTARAGVPTRYGSRLMASYVPEASDPLALALDAAGGISLGKTATPEFGLPSYTETLIGPPTTNPWDVSRGPGGSSGGAAAAVAARLLPFAPGSDGGGSVRIPAAATGLVGIKPSRGRVPAATGQESLAGLPVPGPLARTVADAALLLDAMIGDGRSPFTLRPPALERSLLDVALHPDPRPLRIGVTLSSPWENDYELVVSDAALAALDSARRELAALGHDLVELTLDPAPEYAAAFRTIWMAGAAGIPAEGDALLQLEPLTGWLVGRGREVTARELGAALAELAGYERRLIAQLNRYDAVLTPALAMTPRPIGWYDAVDGERNFAQQVQYTPYTSWLNVSGLPAIALPVAETVEGGVTLPMGVQVIGRPGREDTLVSLGAAMEDRLHWERRIPPLAR